MNTLYLVKYQVSTIWHNPYNITTYNDYTEIVEAQTAEEAVKKILPSFSNPNKNVNLVSVKKI